MAFECAGEFAFNCGGKSSGAVAKQGLQAEREFAAEFLPVSRKELSNLPAMFGREQRLGYVSEGVIGRVVFELEAVGAGSGKQLAIQPQQRPLSVHGVRPGAIGSANIAHLDGLPVSCSQKHRVVGGQEYPRGGSGVDFTGGTCGPATE